MSSVRVPLWIFAVLATVGCSGTSDPAEAEGASGFEAGTSSGAVPNTSSDAGSGGHSFADGAVPNDAGGTSSAAGNANDAGAVSVADARGPSSPEAGTADAAATSSVEAIFAAPNGKDSAAGSMADPTSLSAAIKRVTPGATIALRGGTYSYATQLTIEATNSGAPGKLKRLAAYANEKPVLDFSSEPYGTASNPRGLQINGDFWHVIGLELKGAADNGIYVAGDNNVIESCVTHGNRDTGLQLGRASSDDAMSDWPANNLILNCESYDNYDAPPGSGENADGFAAKLTVGPGNVFRGCVAHHNSDDGWDLFTKSETGPIGSVTIDQCIAHHNGTLTDGTMNANGDRNGFKLGGDKIAVSHTVTRSVAFANGKNGFTWNSNPGAIRLFNNLAFDNAEGNYSFGSNSVPTEAIFANNVSFWTSTASDRSDKTFGSDLSSSNAFWDAAKSPPSSSAKGLIVSAEDFAAPLTALTLTRAADGTLNLSPFTLVRGSDLLNAGVTPPGALPFDAANYYVGGADLGAVELR